MKIVSITLDLNIETIINFIIFFFCLIVGSVVGTLLLRFIDRVKRKRNYNKVIELKHCVKEKEINNITKENKLEWDFKHLERAAHNNKILINSDKIFVSFRFDLNTYNSWVVLTGRTYDENGNQQSSEELLISTPKIPLIGGCWSNLVAMRMLDGQKKVSLMLDEVYYWLKYGMKYELHCNSFYVAENRKKNMEIIKVDRCIYAPFLYLTADDEVDKVYMDFLTENYPEAYRYALKCNFFSKYLSEYHDRDVEAVFD